MILLWPQYSIESFMILLISFEFMSFVSTSTSMIDLFIIVYPSDFVGQSVLECIKSFVVFVEP